MQLPLLKDRQISGWTIALAVFLAGLFTFLAVRAHDEYRWSDWGFGDAQTMLSLKQWDEGGWIHNYLLFKPQGYANVIDALDDPELRHHAHGTCPGSSPNVGPRLWYTHYPAGYLIPYAVLFKLGLESLFAMRLLSVILSIGALALMYLVFSRIASPRVSFVAVFFYGLSATFLGYADSLANQPIDDLLRFGFMLAVIMGTRAAEHSRMRWMIAAWIMEFCLSLTSFDSVFFIFVWLIGWDLLEKRGFRWKLYFLFGMAPVTAHGLQFLQNVWYLGWPNAVLDIKDAFLLKHGTDTGYNLGQGRLGVIATSLFILFNNLMQPVWVLPTIGIVYIGYRTWLDRDDRELPNVKMLAVLFASGLAFLLILPHAARMPYEARQMIPFASLLVAGFSWSCVRVFKTSLAGRTDGAESPPRKGIAVFSVAYLIAALLGSLILWFSFAQNERGPVYDVSQISGDISFAQQLKAIPTKYDPVLFTVGSFDMFWDPKYVPGFPQIMPITEYYTGSKPLLCFTEASGIADDVEAFIRKAKQPFSPVLVAATPEQMSETMARLRKNGILQGPPIEARNIMGRVVIDLTDSLRWGTNAADTHTRKP